MLSNRGAHYLDPRSIFFGFRKKRWLKTLKATRALNCNNDNLLKSQKSEGKGKPAIPIHLVPTEIEGGERQNAGQKAGSKRQSRVCGQKVATEIGF